MRRLTLVISGMELDVYSQDAPRLDLPLCALFVIHALYGDRRDARHVAEYGLREAAQKMSEGPQSAARDLVVVAIVSAPWLSYLVYMLAMP